MNNNFIQIGILDIQGSVAEHAQILKDLKQDFIYVKSRENLKNITHLIIPGGESTTIIKLLKNFKIWEILVEKTKNKSLNIFGTCAGAIISQQLGMPIEIERNAYGAQQCSFIEPLNSEIFKNLTGIFIRAPKFKIPKNSKIKILAKHQTTPVLIEYQNFLSATFHPEISKNYEIYQYFLKK